MDHPPAGTHEVADRVKAIGLLADGDPLLATDSRLLGCD